MILLTYIKNNSHKIKIIVGILLIILLLNKLKETNPN